jgi:hypothetical protein
MEAYVIARQPLPASKLSMFRSVATEVHCRNVDLRDADLTTLRPRTALSSQAWSRLGNRRSHADLPSAGAIGCYLSHVACWQSIVERGLKNAWIFEEDATLTVDADRLHRWATYALRRWDYVAFGAKPRAYLPVPELTLPIGPLNVFVCTHAQAVTQRGAQLLLRDALPLQCQVDAYIASHPTLRRYHAGDLVQQDQSWLTASATHSFVDKLCWPCMVPPWLKQIAGAFANGEICASL